MSKTEIGEILEEYHIDNPFEMSDEELLDIKGIGKATLKKIRDAEIVSNKFLYLGKGLNVSPGEQIPPEYDPLKYVKRGQAEWR